MKKVLLATTAVALSAGVAYAEISFSGSARMGLVYTGKIDGVAGNATTYEWDAVTKSVVVDTASTAAPTSAQIDAARDAVQAAKADIAAAATVADRELAEGELAAAEATLSGYLGAAETASSIVLDNRVTINVDASTETSSGLTFGARLRIRSNDGNNASVNGARVYMTTGGLEVAVGNIYGAIDSMPGMYDSEVGLTALSDAGVVTNSVVNGWGFDGYSSTGSQMGVEAIYTAGAFTGHLSYTDEDLGSATNRIALVGAYTMNDWTVALGVQDSENNSEDKTILTVGGKIGDFGVGFAAADNDGVTKIALNGSASFGATTVNGFIADDESGTDLAVGVGVAYDLGGASVVGGIERDALGVARADFGVSFAF